MKTPNTMIRSEKISNNKRLSDTANYYMALSHKDWELPNSRIWLAEMDIDRGLDFPISTGISTGNVLK